MALFEERNDRVNRINRSISLSQSLILAGGGVSAFLAVVLLQHPVNSSVVEVCDPEVTGSSRGSHFSTFWILKLREGLMKNIVKDTRPPAVSSRRILQRRLRISVECAWFWYKTRVFWGSGKSNSIWEEGMERAEGREYSSTTPYNGNCS